MSHRVKTQIDVTDASLAIEALRGMGLPFTQEGKTIRISGGRLKNAVINLANGEITGDTDFGHTEKAFGLVRQRYNLLKTKRELALQGGVVINEEVLANGVVRLTCSTQ